ncbi:MAG: hypothetical protein QM675_02570 [Protaetiibacter sp.]
MNESLTVVIERNADFASEFLTEPYETAWAREACWFLVLDEQPDPGVTITVTTEISPDGLNWCAQDRALTLPAGERVTSWANRDFGGWLRIRGVVGGSVRGSLYLALKA